MGQTLGRTIGIIAILLQFLLYVPSVNFAATTESEIDEEDRSVYGEADDDDDYEDGFSLEFTVSTEQTDQPTINTEATHGRKSMRQTSTELKVNKLFVLPGSTRGGIDLSFEIRHDQLTSGEALTDEFATINELWVGWRPPSTSPSFWFGRKAFSDQTGWWWDEELVGLGATGKTDSLSFSVHLATSMDDWTTLDTESEPEDNGIIYLLGHIDFLLSDAWTASTFFTHKQDRSDSYQQLQTISESRFDEIDDSLSWLGIRHQYVSAPANIGELTWDFDIAYMKGSRTRYSLEEDEEEEADQEVTEPDNQETAQEVAEVAGSVDESLSGWAVSGAVTWQPRFSSKTQFRLGYAVGSGTRRNHSNRRNTFQQTGLQSNESDTLYYGVLVDPELTNLQIGSFLASHDLSSDSTLHFQYNHYRRNSISDDSLEWDIDLEPETSDKFLGFEAAIIVDYYFGNNLTGSVTAARFEPGNAFAESDRGALEHYELELSYEF